MMRENGTENFIRYLEIKRLIKGLSEELEEIKEAVVAYVIGEGGRIEDDAFRVSINNRPNYKFSPEFNALKHQVKERRQFEIQNKIAVIESFSTIPVVIFKG